MAINPEIDVDSLAPMKDKQENVELNIKNIHDTLEKIQEVLRDIATKLNKL